MLLINVTYLRSRLNGDRRKVCPFRG